MASTLLTDVTPLRKSPQFRRLFTGSLLSAAGGALTAFAIPLQVYAITRSPFAVGAIGLAELIPTLSVGLLGGPVIDALEQRRLVLITSSLLAVVSGALAAQAFAGLRAVWLLYLLVVLQAGLFAVNTPARRTFIPSLLGPDLVAAGLALNRIGFQLSMILGPALAGLITAAAGGHLSACYLIDAVTFSGAPVRRRPAAGHAAARRRRPPRAGGSRRGAALHPAQPGSGGRVSRRPERDRAGTAGGTVPVHQCRAVRR